MRVYNISIWEIGQSLLGENFDMEADNHHDLIPVLNERFKLDLRYVCDIGDAYQYNNRVGYVRCSIISKEKAESHYKHRST